MNIKELRRILGVSQEKLAGLVGVSARTISSWERQEHQPCPLARERLERLTQIASREPEPEE